MGQLMSYLLLIFATVLLAVNFTFTKLYEQKCGTAFETGLKFNIIVGFSTALIFFAVNGFKLQITFFSLLMAALQASSCVVYTIIGFKIMEKENVADYTFFLMTGGMTVPYVYGLLFLKEEIKPFHLVGLAVIIIALLFKNGSSHKNYKTLLLCVSVFFLNGTVSVASKVHQIGENTVGTTEFVVLAGIFKGALCLFVYLIMKKKSKLKSYNKQGFLISVLSAVISGASSYLQLKGAISLPATVLYPIITGGCILFTALAGAICFKEKITLKTITSMGLCLLGTCLFL